ncbi:MAG: hypothetical protein ABN479_08600 [Billgrantia sp.]
MLTQPWVSYAQDAKRRLGGTRESLLNERRKVFTHYQAPPCHYSLNFSAGTAGKSRLLMAK